MKKLAMSPVVSYWGDKVQVPLIRADLPTLEDLKIQFDATLQSGRISNFGPHLMRLEEELKNYLGCEAITTSSGTQGLILALQALGLRPGDKVLVPSFTFMATVQAILYAKGTPVFADVGDDLLLSAEEIEKHLTKDKTISFVIPVHMYGQPCDVKGIQAVTARMSGKYGKKICVLYDAAHAFGSKTEGTLVGNFGDAEVFSLSATKPFVCIEGGIVSSKNQLMIQQLKKMRNYGIDSNYNSKFPGMNGKMSEFHAAVGLFNLSRIETILETRTKKAKAYIEMIQKNTSFTVFTAKANTRHTYKDFSLLLSKTMMKHRDAIMTYLKKEGIETRAYFYPPVHEQDFFKNIKPGPLPKTEDLSRRVLSIPFFTTISDEQMKMVVDALQDVEKEFK